MMCGEQYTYVKTALAFLDRNSQYRVVRAWSLNSVLRDLQIDLKNR